MEGEGCSLSWMYERVVPAKSRGSQFMVGGTVRNDSRPCGSHVASPPIPRSSLKEYPEGAEPLLLKVQTM